MTLEGAINLSETNDYIIYTMNSVTTGQYGVVVPKNIDGTLNMLVDLHMKGSFDGVGSGSKTKEQLVEEISNEYNKLKSRYSDGMLVMPMIDEVVFQNTVVNGDKQKMFDEVKKIGAITSELYKKLTDSGIDKQKVDQKIIIIEKNDEDVKFVTWLKEQSQMSNFVDGVLYNELISTSEVINPFVVGNDIFGTTPVQTEVSKVDNSAASAPVTGGGIFDNVTTVAPVVPAVENVSASVPFESVEAVSSVAPVEPLSSAVVESVTPVAENVVTSVQNPSVDVFGNSASVQGTVVEQPSVSVESVAPQSAVVAEVPVSPVAPTVEGPKPVESAMLEGTIAFTPIPNHPNNPTNESVESDVDSATNKGSKGFVNLAILLVVLVGVTLISIELGKYLYSVYGA